MTYASSLEVQNWKTLMEKFLLKLLTVSIVRLHLLAFLNNITVEQQDRYIF